MQCVNGKTIKEERDCDVRTVMIGDSQKIILSPRVEIHRVLKAPPDELDHPQQIIYTTTATNRTGHLPMVHIESSQQPIQRVQVIKDGRFYEEPSLQSSAATIVRSGGNSYNHEKGNGIVYQSSPPPLLHHSQPQQQHQHLAHSSEQKKIILSRQINVISNVGENRGSTDMGSTTVTAISALPPPPLPPPPPPSLSSQQQLTNGTGLFRPPVVSSTSNPMRPPPPPPPPRIKGASPEEPSSSIPDLGKFFFSYIFHI